MNELAPFSDLPVIGQLSPDRAAAKLRELGEDDAAAQLESPDAGQAASFGASARWPFRDRPWQHTAHSFGYLAPLAPGSGPAPIQHAGAIAPDSTLKNSRIKITLDRLRVAAYPGGGTHRILFDCYAQNQIADNPEHLHFSFTYRVREGEQAAVVGYPVFVGLGVGTEGVAFKCFTVNVRNDQDESFLGFLESDVFKAGLKLAATAQPAVALFSQMALGLTRSIASRHRNVPVQDFYMGLDFSSIATRARLREGSYIAVQIPETLERVWDWSEWQYHPSTGHIVNKEDPTQLVPYNYLVYSISRIE